MKLPVKAKSIKTLPIHYLTLSHRYLLGSLLTSLIGKLSTRCLKMELSTPTTYFVFPQTSTPFGRRVICSPTHNAHQRQQRYNSNIQKKNTPKHTILDGESTLLLEHKQATISKQWVEQSKRKYCHLTLTATNEQSG